MLPSSALASAGAQPLSGGDTVDAALRRLGKRSGSNAAAAASAALGEPYLCIRRAWPPHAHGGGGSGGGGEWGGHAVTSEWRPLVDLAVVARKEGAECSLPEGYELVETTPSGASADITLAAASAAAPGASGRQGLFIAIKRAPLDADVEEDGEETEGVPTETSADAAAASTEPPPSSPASLPSSLSPAARRRKPLALLLDVDVVIGGEKEAGSAPAGGASSAPAAAARAAAPSTAPVPRAGFTLLSRTLACSAMPAVRAGTTGAPVLLPTEAADLNAGAAGGGGSVHLAVRRGVPLLPAGSVAGGCGGGGGGSSSGRASAPAGVFTPTRGQEVLGDSLTLTLRGPVPAVVLQGKMVAGEAAGGSPAVFALAAEAAQGRCAAEAAPSATAATASSSSAATRLPGVWGSAAGVSRVKAGGPPTFPLAPAAVQPAAGPVAGLPMTAQGPALQDGGLVGVAIPAAFALELQHAAEGGVLTRTLSADADALAAVEVPVPREEAEEAGEGARAGPAAVAVVAPWYAFGALKEPAASLDLFPPLGSALGGGGGGSLITPAFAAATIASRGDSGRTEAGAFELLFLPSAATLGSGAALVRPHEQPLVEARGCFTRGTAGGEGRPFPWHLGAAHVLRLAWRRDLSTQFSGGALVSTSRAASCDLATMTAPRTSVLSGSDRVLCSACGRRTDHATTSAAVTPPAHLFLHLSRMAFDQRVQRAVKDHAHVPLQPVFVLPPPPAQLAHAVRASAARGAEGGSGSGSGQHANAEALPPLPVIATQPTAYGLYAVIVHSGDSANSGHYYSYARRSGGGGSGGGGGGGGDLRKADDPASPWVLLNDTRVGRVQWATMRDALAASLTDSAYMLLYHKLQGVQAQEAVAEWRAAAGASAGGATMAADGEEREEAEVRERTAEEAAEAAAFAPAPWTQRVLADNFNYSVRQVAASCTPLYARTLLAARAQAAAAAASGEAAAGSGNAPSSPQSRAMEVD
jgi:hypothetical protein